MGLLSSLLNRAILSHLLVAVPPAVILGKIVADINEDALKLGAQRLHLATADQMKDRLLAQVKLSKHLLGQAERILDMDEIPFAQRQALLKAMVADGGIPHLLVYGPDGKFDSLVRAKTGVSAPPIDRAPLAAPLIRSVQLKGFSVAPAKLVEGHASVLLLSKWSKGQETLGFLGTTLSLQPFRAVAKDLVSRHLGDSGALQVLDGSGRYIISTIDSELGQKTTASSPFGAISERAREDLSQISTGTSMTFDDAQAQSRLGSVISAPELGWLIGTSRTVEVAFASLQRVRLRSLLLALAAGLGAGIFGLLLARQISAPIQALIRAVGRVHQDGFREDAKVTASGELGQLASAFNSALAQMGRYRSDLKKTTQMRLRLSRLVSPDAVRDFLAQEATVQIERPPQPVTILYADLTQSDELRALAIEDLTALLGDFFAMAHETLLRSGGRVDRYSGDAVIGIFQSPDHAQAGLKAARELLEDTRSLSERWQERARVDLEASVGLATGAAPIVPDADGELSVSGALPERAAQLHGWAAPGKIAMDEGTRKENAQVEAEALRDGSCFLVS